MRDAGGGVRLNYEFHDSCSEELMMYHDRTGMLMGTAAAAQSWAPCMLMRSRTTRSMRKGGSRNWFWINSPTIHSAAVASGRNVIVHHALFASIPARRCAACYIVFYDIVDGGVDAS